MTKLGIIALVVAAICVVGCKSDDHVSSPDKPTSTSSVNWKDKTVAETVTIPKSAHDRLAAAFKSANVELGGGWGANQENLKIHFKRSDEAKAKEIIDADAKANHYTVTYS